MWLAIGLAIGAAGSAPAAATETAHTYNDGGMIGFGSVSLTDPAMPQPLNSPVFSGAATHDGGGYVLASADGGVFAYGDATSRVPRAAFRCRAPSWPWP